MIVTYTGRQFDYNNITKDSISVSDIIPAITRQVRYMGHTKRAYGAGEHTLMCYLMAKELGYTDREMFLTLIHDFSEAYLGDVNTDLKMLLPDYRKLEKKVELAIYEHLGIEPPNEEESFKVKSIDYTMLIIEMRDLTRHNYDEYIEKLRDYVLLDMLNDESFRLWSFSQPKEKDINIALLSTFKELYNKIKEGN